MHSTKKVIQIVKSITAREIFRMKPEVKKGTIRREILDRRVLYQYGRAETG